MRQLIDVTDSPDRQLPQQRESKRQTSAGKNHGSKVSQRQAFHRTGWRTSAGCSKATRPGARARSSTPSVVPRSSRRPFPPAASSARLNSSSINWSPDSPASASCSWYRSRSTFSSSDLQFQFSFELLEQILMIQCRHRLELLGNLRPRFSRAVQGCARTAAISRSRRR